ncbi:MAG: gfo/Idh/MocA family oxidoreductase, partial [Deltaproteobacteria bacterium]|nr:gfo/Idh/MocA family oxidoreductase [Deltaproteobacteria bacterium]
GWIGTYGQPKDPNHHGKARRSLRQMARTPEEEAALKASYGYGGTRKRERYTSPEKTSQHQNHWGVMIVSCEKGDLRQSADGILIYDENGLREVSLPQSPKGEGGVIHEFYDAVVNRR